MKNKKIKFKPDVTKDAGKSQGVNFRTGPHKSKRDKRKKDKIRESIRKEMEE